MESNITLPKRSLSPETRDLKLKHYALEIDLQEMYAIDSNIPSHNNNKVLNQTQLNLIEMASNSAISATAYGINVKMGNQPLKCFSVDSPNLRTGLDRKIYFAAFIHKYRIMACIDSGSDLTLMQENQYLRKRAELLITLGITGGSGPVRAWGHVKHDL